MKKPKVFQNQKNSYYDNKYSKPPQILVGSNYSVSVIFSVDLLLDEIKNDKYISPFVNAGTFSGQYDYASSTWSIHGLRDDFLREINIPQPPPKEKHEIDWSVKIPDCRVSRWWHLPEYDLLCDRVLENDTKKTGIIYPSELRNKNCGDTIE